MTQRLGRIGTEQILAGIQPDLVGTSAALFVDGRNTVFTDKAIQPVLGSLLFLPDSLTTNPIIGLCQTVINGLKTVFYADRVNIWRWDEETAVPEEVGGDYTGTDDDLWSMSRWGNWVVATNNVDEPQIYKVDAFEAMSGVTWDTNVLFVRSTAFPFMLAFETAGGSAGNSGKVHWCHEDDIDTWDPFAFEGCRAGALQIRDLDGPIVAALPLGNNVAFYTRNSMHLAQYITSIDYTFGAHKLLEGIGAYGKFSVASDGFRHYGIGPSGIWMTDGSNYTYIDAPVVRDFVGEHLDFDKAQNCVVWVNNGEHLSVEFFFPSTKAPTTKPDMGVAFNALDRNWSILAYGRCAVSDTGVLDFSITGDDEGFVYAQGLPGPITPAASGRLPLSDETIPMQGSYGGVPYGGFNYG